MDITEFCKDYSIEELKEIKKGIKDLEYTVLKKYVSTENLNVMMTALHEKDVMSLDEGIVELAICCLCNVFNKELIEREIFRREMEHDNSYEKE